MTEWYVINDLDKFTIKARTIAFNSFGISENDDIADNSLIEDIEKDSQQEFDRVISHDESLVIVKSIVKKQRNKKTKQIRYILDNDLFIDIISSLNERMISNILSSLVNRGLVETSFDSDINDFVFWLKDNENDQKPETD